MMKVKAITISQFHSLNDINIIENELPELSKDMLEVQVHYCGINFADLYTIHQLAPNVELPFVLGIECSGIVVKTGSNCGGFKVGDKVVCYDYKGGLHCEQIRIHCNKCYKIPDSVDLQVAAAIFVNYLTAWFALFNIGNLQREQKLFISSCAGGVGLAAINLTKHLLKDVQIFGTASLNKQNFLNQQSVTFINYETIEEDLYNCCKFDLVLESMSTATRTILMKRLKPFGKCVVIGAKDMINGKDLSTKDVMINPVDLIMGNCEIAGLHLGILADDQPELVTDTLNRIFQCIFENKIKPLITIYDFKDAKLAYEYLSSRTNIGKILLRV